MSSMLSMYSEIVKPSPAELLNIGWAWWWKSHKNNSPPVNEFLQWCGEEAFLYGRDDLLSAWCDEIRTTHSRERLLRLLNRFIDMGETYLDMRQWEYPYDPEEPELTEEEQEETREINADWVAFTWAAIVWTTRWLPAFEGVELVSKEDVIRFLANPPPKPSLGTPKQNERVQKTEQLSLF